jgi:hypothetical protein
LFEPTKGLDCDLALEYRIKTFKKTAAKWQLQYTAKKHIIAATIA